VKLFITVNFFGKKQGIVSLFIHRYIEKDSIRRLY